jgi:HPt (histidine-containing phosphotransfer) domain-containing protein
MGQSMSSPSHEAIDGIIDLEELLARCMGNLQIAERVLTKFQDRFGVDLGELEQWLDQHNAGAIATVAHRMKGASANVGAPALYEVTSELEQLGRAERIAEIPSELQQLRSEWTRFTHHVSALQLSQRRTG